VRRIGLWIAILVAGIVSAIAIGANAKADDDAGIKALEDQFATAVKAKDVDKIMASYEKSADLVVFDVIPPRQYTGWDAYKKDWQGFLGGCQGPVTFEMADLSVTTGPKIAFGHSIQHFVCTDAKGNKQDVTLRVTDGYRKTKGKWLIAHEHISVPVDVATGKADLTSKP